ncbi:MAG: iron ABC transporter [Blastocatellia bacterium]|nr:MAG: iron ABC transporter [Blastocatellia bacterium]
MNLQPIRVRLIVSSSAFGALLLALVVTAPVFGSTRISLARVFDRSIPFQDNLDAQIFFIARLPRVVAAAIVGGSLAAAGVVFQALLRNPLASPDTLGVSTGAALGAMLAITFHLDITVGGVPSVPLASFIGALGALGAVYALASGRRRGLSTTVLLLAGVTMTAFLTALILFAQYMADFTDTFRTVRWMMGVLDVGSYTPILAGLPMLFTAYGIFATLPRALDLLSLGADAAAARGVDVVRAERLALVSASLATGAAVAISGPVGFIGIVVPHLIRLLVGSDHRLVLPASILFGAAFLIVCDLVARTLFAPVEFPVGVITALIGGPFFLWLLVRSSQ